MVNKEIIKEKSYEELTKLSNLTAGFYDDWYNEAFCLQAVKINGCHLRFVKVQTEEICLEAIKEHPIAIQYVKKLTKEMCLKAFEQNPSVLIYIDKRLFN